MIDMAADLTEWDIHQRCLMNAKHLSDVRDTLEFCRKHYWWNVDSMGLLMKLIRFHYKRLAADGNRDRKLEAEIKAELDWLDDFWRQFRLFD